MLLDDAAAAHSLSASRSSFFSFSMLTLEEHPVKNKKGTTARRYGFMFILRERDFEAGACKLCVDYTLGVPGREPSIPVKPAGRETSDFFKRHVTARLLGADGHTGCRNSVCGLVLPFELEHHVFALYLTAIYSFAFDPL